jgi:iron-sulfur cluster assembly protein
MAFDTQTGTDAPATPTILSFTAKAIEAFKEARIRENMPTHGIRVSVVGGGCSGYQYGLDFEEKGTEMDMIFDFDGVKVFCDPMSAPYLKGTVVDYVVGFQGAGFKFTNPNAVKTCGCGSSFSA